MLIHVLLISTGLVLVLYMYRKNPTVKSDLGPLKPFEFGSAYM